MKIYRVINYKNNKKVYDYFFNNIKNDLIEINLNDTEFIINYLLFILNVPENIVNFYGQNNNKNYNLLCLILMIYDDCIIINDKIVIKNYDLLMNLTNFEFVGVKSCVNDNLFMGFFMSKKNNKLLFEILQEIIISKNTTEINKILYDKIKNNNKNSFVILNENIENNISHINDNNNNIFAEHYYSLFILDNLIKIPVSTPTNLSNIKIGLTFDVPDNLISLYSNGIRQNALYFFELLKNMKYDVKLIIQTTQINKFKKITENIKFYNYEYSLLENIFYDEFNLIFSFGFSLEKNIFISLKFNGTKIVGYMCGNSYLIESETILYNQHESTPINNCKLNYDEVWSIPQMYKQNKYYWEILNRTKCIQIPFIWSSNSIEFTKLILNITNEEELLCKKKNNKIAIFEPNVSIMKWCLPCMLICEHNYRKYRNIENVYVTNIEYNKKIEDMKINKFNIKEFTNLCQNLDIFKEKKMTVEKRYNSLDFMKEYAYICVSHQWENPLNYLYFDLAWMGWPILHNAYLCKDVGYYYDDFNYEEASDKLNEIINNHEMNIDQYTKKNRKIINNYLPTNIELQNKYRNLINNLFV